MKLALAISAILVVVLVSLAEANPQDDVVNRFGSTFDEPKAAVVAAEGRSDRHRRVTCDLLSFNTKWGSINHAACAAHCLAMMKGYRGGHCDSNGVCICRK